MTANTTQPEPAEGARKDDAVDPKAGKPASGVSSQEPAEGADELPAGGRDSAG